MILRAGLAAATLALTASIEGQDRGAPAELDALEIRSLPLPRAVEDYAQPTEILTGRELEERLKLSLGDTLDGMTGVASTRYFPGASRPIIRGFSNDRIRVMNDGIDSLDASVGSLDHAVAMEPMAVDRIEIIRGPATLLYGSNAVGGAVNVIDSRIPRSLPEKAVEGRLGGNYESASRGWTGRYEITGQGGDGLGLAILRITTRPWRHQHSRVWRIGSGAPEPAGTRTIAAQFRGNRLNLGWSFAGIFEWICRRGPLPVSDTLWNRSGSGGGNHGHLPGWRAHHGKGVGGPRHDRPGPLAL